MNKTIAEQIREKGIKRSMNKYLSARLIFKYVFIDLVENGIYPGPTALNLVIHNRYSKNLSGRECRWRRELMQEFNISLKRPDAQSMMKDMYDDSEWIGYGY